MSYAFVTLLSSDAYLPGALAVAAALSDVHQLHRSVKYDTVCLVTPETVDVATLRLLRKAFDVVIGVELIVPPDADSLTLLGRPDLDTALTKLHVFRLTQYAKIIFLDADVLPLRPLSHLFLLDHDFSAVPDVGWPDIFNSGVMVLSPSQDTFKKLQELLSSKGTWDGADQGLLNEWRGSNWNRLSFTYNTTPTAIYTYAPAYQRFGSQISIVHFIGPHKPWHSIPFRAPGSTARPADMDIEPSSETPATPQRVYDYASLVDRWYDVYDQHYRSQVEEATFQPDKFTSVWDEGDPRRVVTPAGALGLEELRRAALDGMGTIGSSVPRASGEGEYRTMPLEGRFDLMRPRTRAERKQAQDQTPKDSTEPPRPTPVPAAPPPTSPEPSTPPEQTLTLPSGSPVRWGTLPTPGVHELPPAPHARPISLPPTPLRYVPPPYKPRRMMRDTGVQTDSPAARLLEPITACLPVALPSIVETPPNAVPDSAETHSPEPDRERSLFSPPSFDTSLSTMEFSPSKLSAPRDAVFSPPGAPITPEGPRSQGQYRSIPREVNSSPTPDPGRVKRVFPWEERARRVPGRVFPDEGTLFAASPHPPIFATPERKAAFRSPMPSPLFGFPPSFQSRSPSDSPSPQKHPEGISWSAPSPSPLGFHSELNRAETSSQDGDVEDEVDSEDERRLKSRSRSSSIDKTKRNSKYRSVGVQTGPRDLREEGIQVTTFVPVTEVAEKLILMNQRLGRNWVTSTSPPASGTTSSSSSPSTPALLANAEAGLFSPSISPHSSDGTPPHHTRKGSRVWDPARGIESFKRGSEEVLAKFMKKGTWDECA